MLHKILIICFVLARAADSMGTYVNLADKKIVEEIAIGSLIADLGEESALTDRGTDMHFTFLDDIKTSIENTYFLLDAVTGRLTSKRYLDRESMCLNKHCSNSCLPSGSCLIDVKVLLIPAYNIYQFKVEVQDINDNRPYFASDYQMHKIAEDVAIGHRIPIEHAYDPDFGINSIQTYRLIDKHVPFELVLDQALGLKLVQKLDREQVSDYNLTIEACDGGKPVQCAQTLVHIVLIDVNDNKPKFKQDNYKFKVNENQLNSPIVGVVKAVDLDQGINSFIKYSLVNNPGNYFSLNEDTGELRLNKWFDYEKEKYFSLNIEAKDTGPRSLQAYTNVEIFVQDLDDNRPEISVSFLNEFYRNVTDDKVVIYVPENLDNGKFLAHVQIQDKDEVSSANLEWNVFVNNKELKLPSILDQEHNYFKINKLNSESFTLNTGSKLLDRETLPFINISIRATDQINTVFNNFTIFLLDQNDNTPLLDKQSYDLNINENNYVDQLIHKFESHDPDFGQNGMVIYSLEPTVDFVYIEPLTGYLRASKVFDSEKQSEYEFNVVVRDNPTNSSLSRSSTAKCRLNIIDLNDNKPFIMYNSKIYKNISLSIEENLDLNSQIAKFKCIDKDSSSKILFYLKNQVNLANSDESMSQMPFRLAPDGSLINSKQIDREEQSLYELQVVCSDGKYNASLNVKILINDLNDNCARNLNPSDKIKFVSVSNLSSGDTLFNEFYTDDDSGINGDLVFELVDQTNRVGMSVVRTHDKVYQMNLSVTNSSLFNRIGKYSIRVKVRDMADKQCEIVENFVLLVGNEEYFNKSLLLQKINKFDFMSHMSALNGSKIVFFVVLAGFFVSMATFLLILLLIFVCKKNRLAKQRKEIDGLKVRNYRLMETVANVNATNRLSLSTDQSGDSVSSETTKETTSPSPSSKSTQQLTFFELTSFQKTNIVRVSDYSAGSSDGSECNELNEMINKKRVRYNDEALYCHEEHVPCLVENGFKNKPYSGQLIRSSIV